MHANAREGPRMFWNPFFHRLGLVRAVAGGNDGFDKPERTLLPLDRIRTGAGLFHQKKGICVVTCDPFPIDQFRSLSRDSV